MNSAWTGEYANENRLVESAAKALYKIGNCFSIRLADLHLSTIEDVELAVDNLRAFQALVDGELGFLKKYLAHCQARRNAPKRAQALEDCDKILMKLDSIRDIICRSIEGDDDVVCTEAGAETISTWLEHTISILPQLAQTAYVVEEKNKLPC